MKAFVWTVCGSGRGHLLKSILKTHSDIYSHCCINCMESKMDFETLDDQNFLISFTDFDWNCIVSFVARHRRHFPFPRHRVEGHRHLRQTSRFTAFYTFPDFCLRSRWSTRTCACTPTSPTSPHRSQAGHGSANQFENKLSVSLGWLKTSAQLNLFD